MFSLLLSFAISSYSAYWIYNDSKNLGLIQSKSLLWALFSFFCWYIVIPIYFLLVRNNKRMPKRSPFINKNSNQDFSKKTEEPVDITEKTICPYCEEEIPSSFSICPNCKKILKP